MSHGRNYLIGSGHRGGPRRPKNVRFTCRAPNGFSIVKSVPVLEELKKPVSLWYEHNGQWHLHTVVDKENMPDWARNYSLGSAVKKSRVDK